MSVRNETSADSIRARDNALAADQTREPQPRTPANVEHVDRFQQLMQQAQSRGGTEEKGRLQQELAQAGEGGEAARADAAAGEDAVAAIEGDRPRDTGSDQQDTGLSHQTLEQSDAMAFLQAQMGLRGEGVPQPQAAQAPAANAQAMADLVERHVRQMAVGGSDAAGDDGQVLLRMSDSTLPGTDLLLTRTAEGWSLRADSRSRASYDAIREAAPELAKRFAERNLGTLEIDPNYTG